MSTNRVERAAPPADHRDATPYTHPDTHIYAHTIYIHTHTIYIPNNHPTQSGTSCTTCRSWRRWAGTRAGWTASWHGTRPSVRFVCVVLCLCMYTHTRVSVICTLRFEPLYYTRPSNTLKTKKKSTTGSSTSSSLSPRAWPTTSAN